MAETTSGGAGESGDVQAASGGDAETQNPSPVRRAIEVLRAREAQAQSDQGSDSDAAGDGGQQSQQSGGGNAQADDGDSQPSSIADAILDGGDTASTDGDAIDVTDSADPRALEALTKVLELERAAREKERELDERARRLERFQRAAELAEKGDDFAALEALGLSYEELTARAIRGEGRLEPVTEELAALKKQLEELPKTYEEKLRELEQQREQAALEAWRTRVSSTLRTDSERWGLLLDPVATQGRDPVDLVYKTMERHYEASGSLLTEAQAADMLEQSLERRARELAAGGSASKLRKILGLTADSAPAAQTDSATQTSAHGASGATTVTSEATSSVEQRSRDTTAEASRRRAEDIARRLLRGE